MYITYKNMVVITIHANEISNDNINLLIQHHLQILDLWKTKIILDDEDLFKEEVIKNGSQVFDLLILYVKDSLTSEDMKMLCKKISYERMLSGVNISEFVYNSNKARSIIHEYLFVLDEREEAVKDLIIKTNEFFDTFIYQTVLEYSNLVHRRLERKDQFIEDSHKDRLTILGQMSASFVHEFRNPLTSIMGFVKLLQVDHSEVPYLNIIEHELEQLNYRISQFLLASKREQDETPTIFSLKDLLDEMIEFLYPSILSGGVEIEHHIEAVEIYAVRTEIKQVFLNLLMNSLEALKEISHKRIVSITVYASKGKVKICIQNNGPAIPLDKQETIFEPFVTTKTFGTGIGLFVCKELIEKHNGTIRCTSNEYRTQFCITLPTV